MRKLTLVALLVLTGCSGSSDSSGGKTGAAGPVRLELASPDQAVKSWWRVRDAAIVDGNYRCDEYSKRYVTTESFKGGEAVSTGAARVNLSQKPDCNHVSYSREIVEVKVESETRAVVTAKIKATTPIPPGGEPDADDVKRRAQGFPYRYVLEKVGKDWKIAQIYTYSAYNENEPWQPVFSEALKPYVHAYVSGAE